MADTSIDQGKIDRLHELHSSILGSLRKTIDQAIEAGQILREIKLELPHGDFTGWVEKNIDFDIRTAQRYMRAYTHREELKNDTLSLLNDAYAAMNEPKAQPRPKKSEQDVLWELFEIRGKGKIPEGWTKVLEQKWCSCKDEEVQEFLMSGIYYDRKEIKSASDIRKEMLDRFKFEWLDGHEVFFKNVKPSWKKKLASIARKLGNRKSLFAMLKGTMRKEGKNGKNRRSNIIVFSMILASLAKTINIR